MRVLLVTLSDILPFALTQVLNPELEYCAIVVDEPDITKKILENYPPLRDKIFSFYELKECVENFYYDILLCISDNRIVWKMCDYLKKYQVTSEKFFHVYLSNDKDNLFLMERSLHYYKEHATEFEIFATGISNICVALDATKFKKKIFNFGRDSQDLYYDYQIAKFIFNECENIRIKYALIGLMPYSFHYDESKAYTYRHRIFQYLIAFNDLHNFTIPASECRKMFREKFLNSRLSLNSFDLNNIFLAKNKLQIMTAQERLRARDIIDRWNGRNYPVTRKENLKILDDYLNLCKSNKVRAVMFLPPLSKGYMKYLNREIVDEFHYLIRETRKKYPDIVFFDGWKLNGFLDEDFCDVSHLNLKGAAKFSAILNNVIENLEKG
ncbi:MAG: hypothetical protein IKZ58_09490 [Selenomonadaceae bacterium]|nr:hypothetical protein [Selenomonadaceae bacterium]